MRQKMTIFKHRKYACIANFQEFRPAEIRFYLHKEFRAAEIRFYLHKEFCAAEIRFYLHKEYVGAILKKIVILLKENWSHMDNFKGAMLMKIVILLKENWSHMDKFSIYFKIFRDANSWGAMRQEMAIFKRGKSVCIGPNFFQELSFYIQ